MPSFLVKLAIVAVVVVLGFLWWLSYEPNWTVTAITLTTQGLVYEDPLRSVQVVTVSATVIETDTNPKSKTFGSTKTPPARSGIPVIFSLTGVAPDDDATFVGATSARIHNTTTNVSSIAQVRVQNVREGQDTISVSAIMPTAVSNTLTQTFRTEHRP